MLPYVREPHPAALDGADSLAKMSGVTHPHYRGLEVRNGWNFLEVTNDIHLGSYERLRGYITSEQHFQAQ